MSNEATTWLLIEKIAEKKNAPFFRMRRLYWWERVNQTVFLTI